MSSTKASYPEILRKINAIWHQNLPKYKTLSEGMMIEEKKFKVASKVYLNISSFFAVDLFLVFRNDS